MKQKILKLCSIIASCFILLFSLTGCGDRAILNLEVKQGTFEYTYEQDENVSLENLVVIAHYNDETSLEVKYGDEGLTVSTFTTETLGKKEVEIKYGGKTLTVEVTIKSPSETTLLVRSIANLPAVDSITTADRAKIVELRTKYNALSDEGKTKITNYSVLEAAEAKLASLDLAAHKTNSKAALNNYKNQDDYSSTKWELVVTAKNQGITSIDAATTIEAVDTAVATAKAAMDAVETKNDELTALKNTSKAELNVYVQTDYSASNWILVRAATLEAKEAIDAATTTEAVTTALNNAKTAINAIPTLTVEFNTYKENKLSALEEMFTISQNHIVDGQGNRLYDDVNEELILDAIDAAVSSINSATTIAAIDTAYNAAITTINSAKLKVVTDVEKLISDLPATITLDAKTAVDAARSAYDSLSAENKAKVSNYSTLTAAETTLSGLLSVEEVRVEWKNRLDANYTNNSELEAKYNAAEWDDILAYVEAAKEQMDDATTGSQIVDIYNDAIASINTVKEKVVADVETAIKALNKTIALSDEATVVATRNAYNALNGTQKDSIEANVYAYLTNAEAEIIRLKFEVHKTEALATLDTLLESCGNNKYNATNYATIENLINAAKAKINDQTQVTTEVQIDEVVQDVTEDISQIKIKLVTDVEEAILALNPEAELATYKAAVEAARAAYDALGTNKTLVSNYANLLAAENTLNEKLLSVYKAEKIAELNSYLPSERVESDYGPTKMATINSLRAEGAVNINNANSKDAVDVALSNAKQAIDNVETQDEDHYTVLLWATPSNLTQFKTMLDTSSEETAGYLDTSDKTYYIGDDNAFRFQPIIDAEAPTSTTSERITEYRSKSIIKMSTDGINFDIVLKNDIDPTKVTSGYKLSDYVEYIGEYTFEFDFNGNNAIGKYFEISVYPYYGTDELDGEGNPGTDGIVDNGMENFETTYRFKVVDGYNVTKAIELGMMHNAVDADETSYRYDVQGVTPYNEWKYLLQSKGLTLRDVKGIVLHNNINITKNDIPASYLDGNYIHDYAAIYEHVVTDRFDFYGNYFTIDASALPIVNTALTDGGASHLPLFKIWAGRTGCADATCYKNIAATREANFKNLTLIGNGKIDSKEVEKGMGSLIMGKFQMVTTNLENMNINSFMLNIMADDKDDYFGITNINHIKSYDAFQNNLFVFGGSTVNITNSIFGQCGGPAIISATTPKDNDKKLNGFPIVNVDQNTQISSLVNGLEPWFRQYPVEALLAALQNVENFIGDPNGETGIINTDGKMNLIDGGIQIKDTGFGTYNGIFTIELKEENVVNPLLATFKSDMINTGGNPIPTMADLASYGALVVYGSDGSYLVTDGKQPLQSNGTFAAAKYVTIFLPIYTGETLVGGFTVVLEYFHA